MGKGGRKAMIKMETRIRELESELDAENRRNADVTKNLRKSERAIKELTFAADEDRKNHERMQALIDQLQGNGNEEGSRQVCFPRSLNEKTPASPQQDRTILTILHKPHISLFLHSLNFY